MTVRVIALINNKTKQIKLALIKMNKQKLYSIPTNIITGFLGAGKTSSILHLLKQKPAEERWAILVNEFGEIGVDGSLIAGQKSADKNVFIQEVSGGCMCCSSGMTMQIALNQLLLEARPHRLLIEPTGLGHPIEVLQTLSNQYNKDVISLEKIITLVDARNIADERYTNHQVFKQQLLIADIIVGNKLDLYGANDKQALIDYVNTQATLPESITFVEQGQLSLSLLTGKTNDKTSHKIQQQPHIHKPLSAKNNQEIPESGFIKAINKGEGFQSIGWRFTALKTFNRTKLQAFIASIKVTRLKALFITEQGIYSYNVAENKIIESKLTKCNESRIEIICPQINDDWEVKLFNCMN